MTPYETYRRAERPDRVVLVQVGDRFRTYHADALLLAHEMPGVRWGKDGSNGEKRQYAETDEAGVERLRARGYLAEIVQCESPGGETE